MALNLRILLDTNVLIPLHDSLVVLQPNLAHVIQLAQGRHQFLYHPASLRDIQRDMNVQRRDRTLQRLKQYKALPEGPSCPWSGPTTSVNDACDNSILYALSRDAAHVLITEDRKLHAKAALRGLASRVYFIQTAEDWLQRLHEPTEIDVPNIKDVELHELTDSLDGDFFDSLRDAYKPFDKWFRKKARDGRHGWIYNHGDSQKLSALCIYDVQENEKVTDDGLVLSDRALKLCTFKVATEVRGRKIGELFLKASFKYATANACENIFIDVGEENHPELVSLLIDFGFFKKGMHNGDAVFVKEHPIKAPFVDPEKEDHFDYVRRYYPHFREDLAISKFIVPIRPQYHRILFPDYKNNTKIAPGEDVQHVGNAIKLAYLSNSPSNRIRRGDIVLFYRTHDEKAITTLVVVEAFTTIASADKIASLVSRRTVYSEQDIVQMAEDAEGKPYGGVRVMLFRTIEHLPHPVPRATLLRKLRVRGQIQSTRIINDDTFSRILDASGR